MIKIFRALAFVKLLLAADDDKTTMCGPIDGEEPVVRRLSIDSDDKTMMLTVDKDIKTNQAKAEEKIPRKQLKVNDSNCTIVQLSIDGEKRRNRMQRHDSDGFPIDDRDSYSESFRLMKESSDLEDLEKNKNSYRYTEDYYGNAEYCVMSKENFDMLTGLEQAPLSAGRDNKVVVKLDCLYKDINPRKCIDYVIFYSSEKRKISMKEKVFLGTVIYAQRYSVDDEHREILIDNLLSLYIKGTILSRSINFHDKLYKETSGNTKDKRWCPRAKNEMVLIEKFMKTVFKKVLNIIGVSFSIEGANLKMHPHDNRDIDNWHENRETRLKMKVEDFDGYKNVIMERLPIKFYSRDDGYIILTFIGLIRSGEHVISAECREWVDNKDFKNAICLVNTNDNLVGITELDKPINIDSMIGEIKGQLRYVEVEFHHCNSQDSFAFMHGLKKDVEMKIVINDPDVVIEKWLSSISRINSGVKSLKVEIFCGEHYRASKEIMRCIAHSPKIVELKFNNMHESLEAFLVNHFKGLKDQLKGKLKALAVSDIGNLSNSEISDDLLSDLNIEVLRVISVNEGEAANLDQLVDRKIITKYGFKYLFFTWLSRYSMPKVIALKNRLEAMNFLQWPIIVTMIKSNEACDMHNKSEDYWNIESRRFYEVTVNNKE